MTNGHVSACLICEPKNPKPKYINCVDLDAACQVLIREKFRLQRLSIKFPFNQYVSNTTTLTQTQLTITEFANGVARDEPYHLDL